MFAACLNLTQGMVHSLEVDNKPRHNGKNQPIDYRKGAGNELEELINRVVPPENWLCAGLMLDFPQACAG